MPKKFKITRSVTIDQFIRKFDWAAATTTTSICLLILFLNRLFLLSKFGVPNLEVFYLLYLFSRFVEELFRAVGWMLGTKASIYVLSNSNDSIYTLIDTQKTQFEQILENQKVMSEQTEQLLNLVDEIKNSNKIIKK